MYGHTKRDSYGHTKRDSNAFANGHGNALANGYGNTFANGYGDALANGYGDTVTNKHCDTVANKHCDTVTNSSSSSIDYPNAINDVEGPQCHADKYNYTYVNNDAHKHQITDDDQNAKCDQKGHAGIECTNQCNV